MSRSFISFLLFLASLSTAWLCMPICTGKTMVSTLHMGLISCRGWLCELLLYEFVYFARMTRHSAWHRFSIICVPKLVWDFPRLCGLDTLIKFIIIIIFCCVFIPTVRIENPGFLLAIQREPTARCGFRSLSV